MILPPHKRRGDLTDEQWERLEPLLPAQKPLRGRPFLITVGQRHEAVSYERTTLHS